MFRRRVGEATSARGPLSRRGGGQPRLDRGGRPLPSRGVSSLPTVQGAPAQPHARIYFSGMRLSHCLGGEATLPRPLRPGDICVK